MMNLLHLKYALEVAACHSISKAADNLYMNQPNLSRAIKELEDTLNITIFNRTSKGITLTPDGQEFIEYAKRILSQVEEVENLYKGENERKLKFSISVPRASYISEAFVEFARKIDQTKQIELLYKETNAIRAIRNIMQSDYKLGIIRYQLRFDEQFRKLLVDKELDSEVICEFSHVALMSKNSKLASKKSVLYSDLEDCIEVAHADPFVPSLPVSEVQKEEFIDSISKRIFVFERASQFELLEKVNNSFMWVSHVPQDLLDKYGLVQIPCSDDNRIYKDVLIYQSGYKFSKLDNDFIAEICKAREKYL